MVTRFEQNQIARYDWKGLNAAGNFDNRFNPGTGDLTPIAWIGDDSELIDTSQGQGFQGAIGKQLNGGEFAEFTVQNFSIEWWLNPVLVGNARIIYKGYDANVGYRCILNATGSVAFYTRNVGGAGPVSSTAVGSIVPGVTQHIIVSRDTTNVRIYVSGRDATAGFGVHFAMAPAVGNDLFVYCQSVANAGLNGVGGQVRIWDGRALGAADAMELYQLGPNRT